MKQVFENSNKVVDTTENTSIFSIKRKIILLCIIASGFYYIIYDIAKQYAANNGT